MCTSMSRSRWLPAAVSWKCGFRTVSRQRAGEDGSPARPVHPPLLAQLPRHPSSPWTAPDPGRGKCGRIVPRSRRVGNPGQFQTGTHTLRALPQVALVEQPRPSPARYRPKSRRVCREHVQVLLRRESFRLTRLRHEVEHHQPVGCGDAIRASAMSGTIRCGSTLVNHDPGPRMTSPPARSRRSPRAAPARRRSRATVRTRPGVAATATCPRIRRTARRVLFEPFDLGHHIERFGSHRQHPAAGPSSRPMASSAATGSPSTWVRPTSTMLPTGCPVSAPSPENRCWNVVAHSCPSASGPARAANAMRRSPGGTIPGTSRRNRPDEPPSSATVTTAVMSASSRPSAESMACKPWPPPRATTRGRAGVRTPSLDSPARSRSSFPTEIAVHHLDGTGSRRPAGGRAPRRWRRCGASHRCSPPPASDSACPRVDTRRRSA